MNLMAQASSNPMSPSALTAAMDAYLQAHTGLNWFSGTVIVTRDNEPIFTEAYGLANREHQVPNSSQTKFRLGSISKQFTAAAILQLQDRGLLDVQAPVATYLPDYPNGDRITLHHLLTHTAGLPNLTSFPDYGQWMQLPTTLDELVARFQDLPLEFEPGEKYSYSNSGYVLLTKVIETVSGQSYADYLQEHLLNLLGMQNTGYEIPLEVIEGLASGYTSTDEGYQQAEYVNMWVPQGAGGLYSTVDDLVRWNQFLFADERRDGSVLSEKAIAAMTTPHVSMGIDDAPYLFYGYGLLIDDRPEQPRIGHGGGINGFVTNLMHYPNQDVTIAVLSNNQMANPERISEGLAAILFGEPYELPSLPEVATVDPSLYERYVGTYQVAPEFQVRVTVKADQLQIQGTGQPTFTLYPVSETEYASRVVNDLRVIFNQTPDGSVESLTLLEGGYETVAPKVN